MRYLAAFLFLLFGGTAAQACSCRPSPATEEEARERAESLAVGAAALAEVDVVAVYGTATRSSETMRVRRTLAGHAPPSYVTHRLHVLPGGVTSCDFSYPVGMKAFVVIYARAQPGGGRRFHDSGMCTTVALQDERFRRLVTEAIQRRTGA